MKKIKPEPLNLLDYAFLFYFFIVWPVVTYYLFKMAAALPQALMF